MKKISYNLNALVIPNINNVNDRPIPSVLYPSMINNLTTIPSISLPNNKIYKLDTILEEPKHNELLYSNYLNGLSNIPSLPSSIDLRNMLYPIRDQGEFGSGIGHAMCTMREWQETNIGEYTKYLSPTFIYLNRPTIPNQGMYLSDGCDIMSNLGSCLSDTFDSSLTANIYTLTSSDIPANAVVEANKYRTANCVLVKTINELKTALFLNGPCVFSVGVYGWKHAMWVPWDLNNINYGLKGGHSMTFVGYNDEGFIVRNSWGIDWNLNYWLSRNINTNGGYDILPYSDFKYVHQIWSTTELSPYIPPYIEPVSNKSDPFLTILCICLIIGVIIVLFFGNK